MNDEDKVQVDRTEVATDAPEETPEHPEPFVYPTQFKTERGEVIDLPWPGSFIEMRFAKQVAEILKLAPQLKEMFMGLDAATAEGMDTDIAAADLLTDVGNALATAVEKVPEMVIVLMVILTGLESDEVGTRLSIMGDGAKLIGLFVAKSMSRLGRANFNLKADVGLSIPTLADVAANAADRGLTGEATDR